MVSINKVFMISVLYGDGIMIMLFKGIIKSVVKILKNIIKSVIILMILKIIW